jgi:signal transduction histidine kinase
MPMVHPEDRPAVSRCFEEALAGVPSRVEVRFTDGEGREHVCLSMFQPQSDSENEGAVQGVTVVAVDVSRERLLERELHRAHRLEMVGRLSTGVVHDLNNLLTVLMGLQELAAHKLPALHPVRSDLTRIGGVAEEAALLAKQILAYSKQAPIPTRRVELNRVVRRIIDLLPPLLPEAVRLECALAEGRLFVQADELQLQQVILNLCLNARDAMPEGGTLTVRTHDGQPFPGQPDETPAWLRISVEDTGMGMTSSVKERLFEPFFTTKAAGSGLGLAVVRQVLEGFGGRIGVTSEPGQGARFDVWLPANEQ